MGIESYIHYILNSVVLVGGEVYVACIRPSDDPGTSRIVAAAAWTPPERYYNSWDPIAMARAGLFGVASTCGLQTLQVWIVQTH